jgi:glucosamine-6-phosphate deaminase
MEPLPGAPVIRQARSRAEMGRAAAHDVALELRARLRLQARVRMIFAAAPSQSEMLDALVLQPGIAWNRVTAFHMDEYIGLPPQAPQRFANWLRAALFDRLPFAAVHVIDPAADPSTAVSAYAALLVAAPIDIVCLGIGVNGHLAFNDPPVADFDDPVPVKIVELDEICRRQQVDDGCFARMEDVPTHAITLTIPRLLNADRLFCVVPGASKREAVRRALGDEIGPACPATALRSHPRCTLYLDAESAPHAP